MTMRNAQEPWDYLVSQLREISERGPDRPNFYETIPDLFYHILPKLVLYDKDLPEQGVDLVHYTTWENALDMFNEGPDLPVKERPNPPVLRMYNYEHSNDPDEGKIKPQEWADIEKNAKWIDDILKSDPRWVDLESGGSTYGCSFSSGASGVEDDLTYWRLYGNDGEGCALKIVMPTGGAYRIYKVRYRDENPTSRSNEEEREDNDVADRLNDIFTIGEKIVDKISKDQNNLKIKRSIAGGLRQILYGYYHLVKHKDYMGENEWRMIKVMPSPETIQYDTVSKNLVKRYIDGPLLKDLLITNSTITVGPTVPNSGAARAYLDHLVRKIHKIEPVDVKNSNKTYRRV